MQSIDKHSMRQVASEEVPGKFPKIDKQQIEQLSPPVAIN